MKALKIILFFISSSFILFSCDVATQLVEDYNNSQPTALSESEVIKGLKRALVIGIETAVKDLSKNNAFYSNASYKILLPEEAKIITDNRNNPLLQAIGVDKMITDVEKSMNIAAERAVFKAKPIFINAITKMSIQDGFSILNGNEVAATAYLKKTTYQQLYNSFKPEVSKTLKQPIYQGVSTQKAWGSLTSGYNQVANFVPSWNSVNTNLDDYVTKKALDALFLEVEKEEQNIRKNPAARVEEILRRVFG